VTGGITLLDTTLRDGIQGRKVPVEGRAEVFALIDAAGVDVSEVGVVARPADPTDAIAEALGVVRNAAACVLAFPDPDAIAAAGAVLKRHQRPRLHVFNSVMARSGGESVCLDGIATTVGAARNACDDVQWAALDASRADPAFVHRAVETAVANGAATINVSDTLGVSLPDEFAALVAGVVERAGDAAVSVHCHDDLGLATANTLAGLRAGARQAEAAINGLGPRGGNTSLQEVARALAARSDVFPDGCRIDADALGPATEAVAALVAKTN